MLRVAVPNKGGLAPAATAMLREAGYRQRTDDKDLTCADVDNDVEFFYPVSYTHLTLPTIYSV